MNARRSEKKKRHPIEWTLGTVKCTLLWNVVFLFKELDHQQHSLNSSGQTMRKSYRLEKWHDLLKTEISLMSN
jgi:hypothetical protein